jgi:hypothetical protein
MKTIAPKVALCIIGILAIIIGGYITWQLCKFCQQHFTDPKQTDPPPAPSLSNVVSEAAWFLQPQSATQLSAVSDSAGSIPCDCGCSFTFTIRVIDSVVVLTNGFVPGSESEAAFRSQLDSFGIHNTGVSSHSSNIQLIGAIQTVFGSNMVTVVIERSHGNGWEPIQTNAFPAAMPIATTIDGPCSNGFFRAVMP